MAQPNNGIYGSINENHLETHEISMEKNMKVGGYTYNVMQYPDEYKDLKSGQDRPGAHGTLRR
jgi:hypothetical protein